MDGRNWTALGLLALIATVNAAGQCKSGCPANGEVLKYQPGHTYEYQVTSSAKTSIYGADDGEKLDVTATALLTATGDCNYVLRVKNVKVDARGKTHGNLKDLEEQPILFNLGTQVTNGEICTSPKEEEDTLNVKRAIVSLLQSSKIAPYGSITRVETDVYGLCPTLINSEVRGDKTIIKKQRNLIQCSHREGLRQDFFTVQRSTGGSSPLLLSDWTNQQTISKDIIQESLTEETYSYRPLSSDSLGAQSHIITKIKLVKEGPSTAGENKADQCKKVQSLIFDTPTHTHRGGKDPKVSDIISAIEACGKDSVDSSVSPREAKNFRQLVNVIRDAKAENILAAYQQAKSGAGFSNKKYAKKVLIDAIIRALTSDSLQVTYELLKSNEIPIESVKLWGPSWGFSRNPCPGSLEAVTHMLDLPNFPREGILGIGALAGRYCQINGCDGAQSKLDALVAKLSKSVKCKANTWEDENKQLVALKALENIGHLSNNVINQLAGCLHNSETTNRVKSAILQTLGSDACSNKARDAAIKVLQDIKQDSELRIRAYHVVVKCPNTAAVNTLKNIYEKEPSFQVGGYIQSHLRNLRASANVEKQKLQKQLGDLRAHKQYPVDIKRFSSNHELSSLLEMIGLGSTSEADIIYSQRSFLPRALTLNVSTELFGHAVNLLELDARAENWEKPLEALLGPKGILKSHDSQELIKDQNNQVDKFQSHFEDRWNQVLGRTKRSAAHPKIQQTDEPQLDLSLKVLGNEIAYLTSKGSRRSLGGNGLIDKIFDTVEEGMNKAKNVDIDNSIHTTFLESEIVYPTAIGFSISLGVHGTAAIHLHLDGKADIKSLLRNPETGHVSIDIQPSADIELTGSLLIDALAVESGVQVGANIHSSTGLQVQAKGVEGTGIDIIVGLPVPKQKILSVSTELNHLYREAEHLEELKPISFPTKQSTYKGCFDQVSLVCGITVCGSVSFPTNPRQKLALSIFQGPLSLEVVLDADDVKSYHLRSLLQGDKEHRKLQLLFDTPNSKTNRKLELIAELKNTEVEKGLSFHLNSPWKEGWASALILNNDKESSIGGQVKFDTIEYIAKVGVEKEGSGNHIRYTPLLEYKTPSTEKLIARKAGKGKPVKIGQGYSVDGAVIVDKTGEGKKYTFDNVVIIAPDNNKYSLVGWLGNEPNTYSTDLKASYNNGQNYHLRGSINHADKQLKVNTEFTSTEYPDIGFSLKLEHSSSNEHLENQLVIVHGKDLASTSSRISLYQQGKWRLKSREDFDLAGALRASYPIFGIDLKFQAGIKPNEINGELTAAYDNKKVSAEVSGKRPKLGDWDLNANGQFLENSLSLHSHRKQLDQGKSKLTNKLILTPGGTYELNADCEHESGKDNLHVSTIVTLIAPKNKVELDTGVTVNPHGSNVHLKLIKDNVKLVDVDSKIVQGTNQQANGNIKASIKDHLVATVEWKSTGQKATGSLEIDCKHISSKITGNGEVSWNKNSLNGNGDLFWNKDKSKSLHLETDTKWGKQVETNSLISLNGKKLALIGKASLDGKLTDGILKGQGELELPDGRKINLHILRELRLVEKEIKVKVDSDLTFTIKDQPHKITVKIDTERLENLIRHYANIDYKCPHGDSWSVETQGKASCNSKDDSWHVDGKLNVKGSNDLQPTLDFSVDRTKGSLKYKVGGKLTADSTLDASGQCLHSQHKWDISNELVLHLPTGELKQVKINDKTQVELHDDNYKVNGEYILQWNENAQAELKLKGQKEKNHVSFEVETQLPNQPKKSIKGEWKKKNDITNDIKVEVELDENKKSSLETEITIPQNKKQGSIKVIVQTSSEKLKKIELYLGHKKNEAGLDSWIASVDSDNTHATIGVVVDAQPSSLLIDLTSDLPNGKSRAYLETTNKGNDYESEIKLVWPTNGGGTLDAKTHARLDSHQDFQIELDVNSPKLKIVNYHLVVANKPAKGGKALLITATEDGQPILSGKLDFRYKIDGLDYKYEADGQLKLKGEPKKTHIILEHKTLTQERNHEIGTIFTYKAQIGDSESEISSKLTNRHISRVFRFCKTKDNCELIVGQWELHSPDPAKYHSEGLLKIQSKALSIDVNVKSTTKTDGWTYDHKITAKTGNNNEYSFHSALTSKDAITVITFGPRIIAAEARWNLDKTDSGHQALLGADVWLDKSRQPNQKAGLIAKSEFSFKDGSAFISGLTKITHPSIGKELEIKGSGKLNKDSGIDAQIELDIFANKNQKIEIKIQSQKQKIEKGIKLNNIINISSKGQNLDVLINTHSTVSSTQLASGIMIDLQLGKSKRGASAAYELNPQSFVAFIRTPGHEILNIEVKLLKEKKTLTSKLQVLDGHNYQMKSQYLPGKIVTSIKQDNELEFDGEADLDLNKGASVVGVLKGTLRGKQVNDELYKVSLNWAEDSVKPEYKWNIDLTREVIEGLKDKVQQTGEKLQNIGGKISDGAQSDYNEVLGELKNYNINLNPILQSYQEEIDSIGKELLQDELIKDISESLSRLIHKISETIEIISKTLLTGLSSLLDYLNEVKTLIIQTSQKLNPQIVKTFKNILATIVNTSQSVLATLLQEVANLLEFIKQYDDELKQLIAAVGELVRELSRVVAQVSHQAVEELKEFVKVLNDQIKALSLTELIEDKVQWVKEAFNEVIIPEEIWKFLLELINTVNQELPTPELRDLFETITSYLDNHIQKKPVDDVESLKLIVSKIGPAIRSILDLLQVEKAFIKSPTNLIGLLRAGSVKLSPLIQLPSLVIQFSPLNWLLSDDLPSPLLLLRSLRPETVGLLDWEPPFTAHAILVDGEHFVTWDRKHFTFKGSCQYVLARDELDGNFTVSVTLENGKFKSVKVTDPKSSIEMANDETLKLDGQPAEYPVHQGDLHAWKKYHTSHILSNYGVSVAYNPTHQVLLFSVNGFYFGRLRGLLGNLNYEQFDDAFVPNGALPEQIAKFANAWKVDGTSCPDGTAIEHHAHGHKQEESSPECSKVFGGVSTLQVCYPFVSSDPFKEACNHAVSSASPEKAQKQACNIGAAYITACLQENPLALVQLPKECVHCTVGSQPLDVGYSVALESPKGLADVVFVIEETKPNAEVYKELVVPLMTTLTAELKTKGITDIHYSLTGYRPNSKWPSQHTNGDKLIFQGSANGISFNEPAEQKPSDVFPKDGSIGDKLKWAKYQLDIETFNRPSFTSLVTAYNYPHRAGAAKAIVFIPTSACEKSVLWPFSLRNIAQTFYQWHSVLHGQYFFLITPIENFDIEGNSKQAKNVVGFDSHTVYLNSDAKKKSLDGQPDLRPKIKNVDNDRCIPFTQAVNGATFNANNFLDAKPAGRKQFIQVTARRVAQSLSRETYQECRCNVDQGLFPTTSCRVTQIKSEPQSEALKVKSHKG